MKDLSILIPSKNEKHLQATIDDIYAKIEMDTEVLFAEDFGKGQRALTQELAKRSTAKYVMKVDAHCIFSQGFDRTLIEDMDDKTIMTPYMLCIDEKTWTPRPRPKSSAYCFDTDLVFQYDTTKENKEPLNETMCVSGAAWIVTRENYWKWNLDDPALGSWGHQGVELGIKAYLNGGRCVTNKKCYFAHLFREKEEDFPYKRDKKAIRKTSKGFRERFKNKDIAGLIKKYNYPANWTKEKVDLLTN